MVKSTTPAVFLFAGNDDYSKEQAINKLKASLLDSSSRELDYKVFDGGEANSRDILDYVSTVPFLASKRLAVIKNFNDLSSEESERLALYIKNPAKTTCLVLDAADDSFIRKYPQTVPAILVSRFGELTDSQFQSLAKSVLSSIGDKKDITPDAARALRELYGNDLGSVSQELGKLYSFVGEKARIDIEDVEEASGRNLNSSAFDLTDAIEANDLQKALAIISELILLGKKHYEIVGLLCWQMKRLFRGRMLLEKGSSDSQIADAVKISRRYQERFFRQLRSSTLSAIESKMQVLLETDLSIKRTKYDPALALEFAVIKLCLGLK